MSKSNDPDSRDVNEEEGAPEIPEEEGAMGEHEAMALGLPPGPSELPLRPAPPLAYVHGIGDRIGDNYEVLEIIGRGGFGRVYKVRNLRTEGLAAIKRPQLSSTDQREMFKREARVGARIRHENICFVTDRDEDEHGPYIVMEFVSGGTLGDLVKRLEKEGKFIETLPALDLAFGILRGLNALHKYEFPIIHRDVKPANVLLDSEEKPKLTDFGLAKYGTASGMSREGYGAGTPGYCAPEQAANAKSANARSDLFSFGKTLRYLLTGSDPHEPERRPVPAPFTEFVERCTQHFAKDRFKDAAEALKELEKLEELVRYPEPVVIAPGGNGDGNACPKCREPNAPDRRHCWKCATPLIETCRACQADNRYWEVFCGGCGIDRKKWNSAQNLADRALQCAQGCQEGTDYDEAHALLRQARNAIGGRAEFDLVLEKTSEQIGYLQRTRNRIESFWSEKRYEQAAPLLNALLKAYPDDTVAKEGMAVLSERIRERKHAEAKQALKRAIGDRDLQEADALLAHVRSLSSGESEPDLRDAEAMHKQFRSDLLKENWSEFVKAIAHERWSLARKTLEQIDRLSTDRQLLFQAKLRLRANWSLSKGDLADTRRLLAKLPDGDRASERRWVSVLREQLHDAEDRRLEGVRSSLLRARRGPALKRAKLELEALSDVLGVDRAEDVLELEKLLGRSRRRFVLREGGYAVAIFSVLAGIFGLLYAHGRTKAQYPRHLSALVDWAIEGKSTQPPQLPAGGLREKIPGLAERIWDLRGFDRQVEFLTQPSPLEELGWEDREQLYHMLKGGEQSSEASSNFISWHRSDLRRRFPQDDERHEIITTLNETLNLDLPVGTPGCWINGRFFEADSTGASYLTLDGTDGLVRIGLPNLVSPETRDISLALAMRLTVDLSRPQGDLVLSDPARGDGSSEVLVTLQVEADDAQDEPYEVNYTLGSSRPWRTATLDNQGSVELKLEALQPFARSVLDVILVDRHGNRGAVPAGALQRPWRSLAELEVRAALAARDLHEADRLLFADSAIRALNDVDRQDVVLGLREELLRQVHQGNPSLTLAVARAALQLPGVPETGATDLTPWIPIAAGGSYWAHRMPISLKVALAETLRDQPTIEFWDAGSWRKWEAGRPVDGVLSLTCDEGSPLHDSPVPRQIRVGAHYLPQDQWIEFELGYDDRTPQLAAGGSSLRSDSLGKVYLLDFGPTPLSLGLAAGKYTLEGKLVSPSEGIVGSWSLGEQQAGEFMIEGPNFSCELDIPESWRPLPLTLTFVERSGLRMKEVLTLRTAPFEIKSARLESLRPGQGIEDHKALATWENAGRRLDQDEGIKLTLPRNTNLARGEVLRLVLEFTQDSSSVRETSRHKLDRDLSLENAWVFTPSQWAMQFRFEAEPLHGSGGFREIRIQCEGF